MALNLTRVQEEADKFADICTRLSRLIDEIDGLVTHNSHQAIDWAAASLPAYIEEDADGNLSGVGSGHSTYTFSRQEVANAIGSLASLAADSALRGNINHLARP